jgi:general L-amino acid transport system permease protein
MTQPLRSPQPPTLPPAVRTRRWLRHNLFSNAFNSVLTLVCLSLLIWGLQALVSWVFGVAQWSVVAVNLRLFFVGRYPVAQSWRLWVALAIAVGAGIVGWGLSRSQQPQIQERLPGWLAGLLALSVSLIIWLIGGGYVGQAGFPRVPTNLWGGLMLTLLVASSSTLLAFPLGVMLALGRQTQLPVLKGFCTAYIELVRGLPLIGILFMAQVMLPLVLPGQPNLDRVLRAIAGLTLFNAAYLAENVRGGLQSIPNGQTEAAKALGFTTPLTLWHIILPQALRIAIPGIVGQFISLFKDTSLLALFALVELTGIGRSILAQPEFIGRYAEVYLFVGLLYWLFCYTLSLISRRLEKRK